MTVPPFVCGVEQCDICEKLGVKCRVLDPEPIDAQSRINLGVLTDEELDAIFGDDPPEEKNAASA